MEQIIIYSLNGCGYSSAALNTLKENNIKHKIYHIDWENKEDYKIKNNMSTFPQIFYEKKNGSKVKIGGNSELNNLLEIIKKTKMNHKFDDMVHTIEKTLLLDNGSTLRLINLLHKNKN